MLKILSKWYIYVIVTLISTVSFCVLTSVKVTPNEDQRITFFIGSPDSEVGELRDKLNESRNDEIMVVNYHYHSIHASNFNFIFSSFRGECDFFILPIDYVEKYPNYSSNYSANLNTEYLNSVFEDELEYYEHNGYIKGFKIYDSQSKTGMLKDYVTYTDETIKCDYYLFFGFESINIGQIHSKTKTNHAFTIIKEMMEL